MASAVTISRKRRRSEEDERDEPPTGTKRKKDSSGSKKAPKKRKKEGSKKSASVRVRSVSELAKLVSTGAIRLPNSLMHYVDDRAQLLDQVFTILSPSDIRGMLPDTLKELKMKQVKQLCFEQLQGMAINDLRKAINPEDSQSLGDASLSTVVSDRTNRDKEIRASKDEEMTKKRKKVKSIESEKELSSSPPKGETREDMEDFADEIVIHVSDVSEDEFEYEVRRGKRKHPISRAGTSSSVSDHGQKGDQAIKKQRRIDRDRPTVKSTRLENHLSPTPEVAPKKVYHDPVESIERASELPIESCYEGPSLNVVNPLNVPGPSSLERDEVVDTAPQSERVQVITRSQETVALGGSESLKQAEEPRERMEKRAVESKKLLSRKRSLDSRELGSAKKLLAPELRRKSLERKRMESEVFRSRTRPRVQEPAQSEPTNEPVEERPEDFQLRKKRSEVERVETRNRPFESEKPKLKPPKVEGMGKAPSDSESEKLPEKKESPVSEKAETVNILNEHDDQRPVKLEQESIVWEREPRKKAGGSWSRRKAVRSEVTAMSQSSEEIRKKTKLPGSDASQVKRKPRKLVRKPVRPEHSKQTPPVPQVANESEGAALTGVLERLEVDKPLESDADAAKLVMQPKGVSNSNPPQSESLPSVTRKSTVGKNPLKPSESGVVSPRVAEQTVRKRAPPLTATITAPEKESMKLERGAVAVTQTTGTESATKLKTETRTLVSKNAGKQRIIRSQSGAMPVVSKTAKPGASKAQTTAKPGASRTQTTVKPGASRSQTAAKSGLSRTQITVKPGVSKIQTTAKPGGSKQGVVSSQTDQTKLLELKLRERALKSLLAQRKQKLITTGRKLMVQKKK